MALTKTAENSNHKVETVIQLEEVQEELMGIDPKGLSHVISRLTDLYKDPIKASVREVVSNAIDATVELPKELQKPVEVTTPTVLSPFFVVRDHGVGMSPEIVKKVYSKYGASTKRTNFTQIGAYGLGAKAPLSYCSEFFTTTIRDGVKTEVHFTRTPEGNKTSILSIDKTSEPNGTTVTIPVRMNDAQRFLKAVETYQKYSADVSLIIDGSEATHSFNYTLFENTVIEEESGTLGRVWVNKDFNFSNMIIPRSLFVSTVLSGWRYDLERSYYREPDVLIELKPGVVSFSSSRDEITSDDRLEAFQKLVVSKYRESNSPSFMKAFLSSSKRDDKSAVMILSYLMSKFDYEKTKDSIVFSDKTTQARTDFPLSLFDLSNGDNAYQIFENVKNTKVTTAFSFYEKSFVNIVTESSSLNFEKSIPWRENHRNAPLFSEVTDRVTSQFSDSSNLKDDFINYLNRFNDKYLSNEKDTIYPKVLFVSYDKNSKSFDDNLKKVLKSRNTFLRENPTWHTVFFIPKKSVSKVEEFSSKFSSALDIETLSIDDYVKRISEIQKSLRVKRTGDTYVYGYKVFENYNNETRTYISSLSNKSYGGVNLKLSVKDLDSDKNVFILGQGNEDIRKYLYGAQNAGETIKGKDIYYIYSNRGHLSAAALEELDKTSGKILVSHTFSALSKIARKLQETRLLSSYELYDDLKSVSKADLIAGMFDSYSLHFLISLSNELANMPEFSEYSEIFKILKDYHGNERRVSDAEYLKERLSVDTYEKVKNLNSVLSRRIINSGGYYDSILGHSFKQFLGSTSEQNAYPEVWEALKKAYFSNFKKAIG